MLTVTWEFVFASWQEEAFLGFIDTHKSWVPKKHLTFLKELPENIFLRDKQNEL